jgi:hypothetical protein
MAAAPWVWPRLGAPPCGRDSFLFSWIPATAPTPGISDEREPSSSCEQLLNLLIQLTTEGMTKARLTEIRLLAETLSGKDKKCVEVLLECCDEIEKLQKERWGKRRIRAVSPFTLRQVMGEAHRMGWREGLAEEFSTATNRSAGSTVRASSRSFLCRRQCEPGVANEKVGLILSTAKKDAVGYQSLI